MGIISNKSDAAFYLFQLGLIIKVVTDGYSQMKAGSHVDWVLIALGVASSLIYAFYEKLTGTSNVPVQ